MYNKGLKNGVSYIMFPALYSRILQLFSKKECPTCRLKCASKRSLRKDERFDQLIQALLPSLNALKNQEVCHLFILVILMSTIKRTLLERKNERNI